MSELFTINHSRYYDFNQNQFLLNLSKLIIATFITYWFAFCFTCIKEIKVEKQDKKSEPLDIKFNQKENEKIAIEKLQEKAFNLTTDYVGLRSHNCYTLAIKFIKELKGLKDVQLVRISESESISGDLIHYQNNGIGLPHWAVKLNEELALNGNWNGKTHIKTIEQERMSKPIYYRVIEKKEK